MSSPFKAFRKHQKVLIATLGILCMVAFVVLPPLMQGMGGGGAGGLDNPPVVRANDQTIHAHDMAYLVQRRNVLHEFVGRAYGQTHQFAFNVPFMRFSRTSEEQDALRAWLLAQEAREMGLTVTDEAVNDYLKRITEDRLSAEELKYIASRMRLRDRPVGMNTIFEGLKEQLLAQKLFETYASGSLATPSERWEVFLRMSDAAIIQSVGLPVTEFVSEVGYPSEEELAAFYEEHKGKVYLPDEIDGVAMASPEVGFRQPDKAKFGYVVANFDDIVDEIAKEISNREVRDYYEANKDQHFVRAPGSEPEETMEDAMELDLAPLPAEGRPPEPVDEIDLLFESDASESETPDSAEPTSEPAPTDQPMSGDDAASPEDEPESANTPKPETPADPDDSPAEKPSEGQPPEPSDSQSAANGETGSLEPICQNEPADDNATSPVDAGETAETDPPADGSEPVPSEPAESESPEAEPTTDSPDTGETVSDEPTAEATGEPADDQSPDEPPTEYIPLEQVEDDIRRRLALDQAAERIIELLNPIQEVMGAYRRDRLEWEYDIEDGEIAANTPPPEPPDLSEFADVDELNFFETDLVSANELRGTPLGQANSGGERQPAFYLQAFSERFQNYNPIRLRSTNGDGYVVWRTELKEGYVPKLEDVRAQVVKAWRVVKARDLAMEAAKRLAEEAREAGGSLTSALGNKGYQIITSEPFTWTTVEVIQTSFFPQPIEKLSKIEGVEGADHDFMKAVFAMDEGDVKGIMNHGKTIAYIVQMEDHLLNLDDLKRRFIGDPQAPWVTIAQSQSNFEVQQALFDQVEQRAGVEWLEGAPPALR